MGKHRRYSRKRTHRKNRRRSRKMIGGVDTPTPPSLHLSDLDDVSGESLNNTEQSDDGFNPHYSGDTTINSNDWSIEQQNQLEQNFPNFDEDPIPQSELNVLDDDIDLDLSIDNSINTTKETLLDDSIGGKRRKRRTSKRRTNKRRTKKSNKTHKYRRKQRGGDSMDTEYLHVNERDKKDYVQMINSLNWDPKQ